MEEEELKTTINILIGLMIGLVISGIVILATNSGVSLNDVGKYMCKHNGYEFKSAHYEEVRIGEDAKFKVVCKQNTTTPIEDGYLVLER